MMRQPREEMKTDNIFVGAIESADQCYVAALNRRRLYYPVQLSVISPLIPRCWPISARYSCELYCQFSARHSNVLGPAI
jgi:hypothetical protein